MRKLPLYKEKRLPVEQEKPRHLDEDCTRCSLHKTARSVCMSAVGEPGGILVIGEHPGRYEDTSGEPFSGKPGRYVRKVVEKLTDEPVAYDYAFRCLPGKKLPNNTVDKCRGYLTQTINEVKPTRVIAMGAKACAAVFGQNVPAEGTRRGIGWLWNNGKPIPVFIVGSPTKALNNSFLERWFKTDVKWALNCDLEDQWMPPYDEVVHVVESREDSLKVVDIVRKAGGCTYDIETTGRICDKFFHIISLAVVPYGTDTSYVWDRKKMRHPEFIHDVNSLMSDPSILKSGTNVKYDHGGVEEITGERVRGSDVDVKLQRHLLFSDVSGELEDMAYLVAMGGHKMEMEHALTKACAAITKARTKCEKAAFLPGIEEEEIEEACRTNLKPKVYAYGLVNDDLLTRYNALDTVATERLRRSIGPQLEKQPNIKKVWDKIVSRTPQAVAQVERWGMPVSKQAIHNYDEYLKVHIAEKYNALKQYNIVNPNSNLELSKKLFNEYQLPILVKTAGGDASTDKTVLKRLASLETAKGLSKKDLKEAQRFINVLLEYKTLEKLKSTYAEGLHKHIRDDGRIHPSINVDGAASGRGSCSDPNLQTLPRKGSNEHADMARDCFLAAPGRKIIQLDYSQLEYRIAAMMSGDEVMIEMFHGGTDFHLSTAKLIAEDYFLVKPEDVTKAMRSQVKNFNFGLLYGMTDRTLAGNMGCTVEEASNIRNKIMGKWTGLGAWIKEQRRIVEKTGYAWTWWDGSLARRRPLWQIGNLGSDEKSKGQKITAINSAHNTPVQGCASDFCIASFVQCVEWLQKYPIIDAKVILTVHDSIMFDCADDFVDEVCETAHDIMLSHNSLDVPIVVDIEAGQSWGSLENYTL